jgi:hypothetical protein
MRDGGNGSMERLVRTGCSWPHLLFAGVRTCARVAAVMRLTLAQKLERLLAWLAPYVIVFMSGVLLGALVSSLPFKSECAKT